MLASGTLFLQHKAVRAALAAAAGLLLSTLLALSGGLERAEATLFDRRSRALAGIPADARPPIRLILLDQASLDWARDELGWSWPWYREAYGRILQYAVTGGAVAVAFDVLYTEPSVHGEEDDRAFGAALAATGKDVLAAVAFDGDATVPVPDGQNWSRLPPAVAPHANSVPLNPGPVAVPAIASNTVFALANGLPDEDGVFRHALPWARMQGGAIASLGLAAHNLQAQHPRTATRAKLTGAPVKLHYHATSADYEPLSAAAVLQSSLQAEAGEKPVIPPETFRDQFVFFGFSAPGLMDLRPTPLSPREPGVMNHVTLLHNLLRGDFMKPVSPAALGLALVLLALAAGTAVTWIRRASAGLAVLLLLTALPIALAYPLHERSLDVPAARLALTALAASIAALALNYATEGKQKAFLKGAFAHYLSPEVIDRIIASPDQLKLGGERRELTMFFSDLEGFSGFSERLSPEKLIALLNEYMGEMTDIILAAGGTLDKYIGDAIVAFWNAPLPQPDHAERAVRAALACQARLAARRAEWKERYGVDLRMRVGINTGEVVVGNMGSSRRFDYTMLGDAANLASRLEGSNKVFHTFTLISAATGAQLPPALPCRELGLLKVVGREQPVTVFEPLAEGHGVPADAFAAALSLLRENRVDEAKAAFTALAEADAPARAYVGEITEWSERGQPWDGVWRPSSK